MKTFLTIVLLLSILEANAQLMVDTGKVWNVSECLNNAGCSTPVYYFQGDTTIGSYVYKKLVCNTDSGFSWVTPPIAAREDSSKKVYFYVNGSEHLYYDFNLNQGDTFNTVIDFCSIQLVVDSVDSVMLLNGEMRKRLILGNEKWIEGIGSSYGPFHVNSSNCIIDVYTELICFTENGILKYHNSNYTTCFYNTLGINEIDTKNSWYIFPNPLTETATLTIKNLSVQNCMLKIFDSGGRLIKQIADIDTDKIIFDRSGLENGFYYFRLSSEKSDIAIGKFVVC